MDGEDPLEKDVANHSSILVWTEQLGGLQSVGLQRVGHDRRHLASTHIADKLESLK